MSYVISEYQCKIYKLPIREVYRYMGAKILDDAVDSLLEEMLPQFLKIIDCRACYLKLPISVKESLVDFGLLQIHSAHLARALYGCSHAVLFAATLGTEADRQRRIASVTSPTKALILDAMGSAAIEAFCDGLCAHIAESFSGVLRPRFSPGYGDLSLGVQKQLLDILDAQRRIGLTLSESMLMLPQKSVSAIVGIEAFDET